MAESLIVTGTSREEKYRSILPQIKALIDGETDLIANVSNVMGALKFGLNFFWVGIYFVKKDELVLGPFQGPVACTRIRSGKGVCGKSWENAETIIVDDVDKFPGHIACSSDSKSEIVIPGKDKTGKVIFVLDVDSNKLSDFSTIDEKYLSQIVKLIEDLHKEPREA